MTTLADVQIRLRRRARSLRVPWVDAAVVAGQAVLLVPFSFLRYVDGDEGDYLLAAKLSVAGEVPYRDFLYTQMPLLPYVYGAWSAVTGESWYAARLLSVAFAVALGTMLVRHLANRFGTALGLLGGTLYVSSTLIFGWFTTVKTQALSTLFVFGAYVLAASGRRTRWLGAGVLLGLAVDTRLIVAGALPAFAWAAYRAGAVRRLGAGLAAGLLPSVLFLALDPMRFWFDNLGYHGARSEGGLVGDFAQKARVAANLLGIGTPEGGDPQFLLLLLLAGAAAVTARSLSGRVPLALAIAAWLGAASLAPTPTYPQYFSTVVPFLVVGVVELAGHARASLVGRPAQLRRAGAWSVGVLVAVYAALASADAYRYVTQFDDQDIPVVRDVTALIDAETRPGEEVLASWPGYLFGSSAAPVPGMENAYAPHEAAALSVERAHELRLATVADVERMIEARRTRIVVFRLWHELAPLPDWRGKLEASGYELVREIGSTRVYRAARP